VNIKREMSQVYADKLSVSLRQRGLEVITSQDINTLLGMERQKAMAGCNESSACMTELANALGADATLVANIARLDDGSLSGSAKLISSLNGKTLSTATLDARNEREFLSSLDSVAGLLAAPWVGAPPPTASATRFWWIPGAVGVAVAGAGGGLVGAAYGNKAKIQNGSDPVEGRALAEQGKAFQTAGWTAVGVGAGLIVAGVVMAVWPSAPVTPTATVTTTGATAGVGGTF